MSREDNESRISTTEYRIAVLDACRTRNRLIDIRIVLADAVLRLRESCNQNSKSVELKISTRCALDLYREPREDSQRKQAISVDQLDENKKSPPPLFSPASTLLLRPSPSVSPVEYVRACHSGRSLAAVAELKLTPFA